MTSISIDMKKIQGKFGRIFSLLIFSKLSVNSLGKFNIFMVSMKTASKELQKLRSMAETSLNKTDELQQVLAQIEATLSRAELQKVIEKTNKS